MSELNGQADRELEILEAGLEDAIAVLHLPEKYRGRLRSTNPLELSSRRDSVASG